MPIVPIVSILVLLLALVFVVIGILNFIVSAITHNNNEIKVAIFFIAVGIVLLFASHLLFGMGTVTMLKPR